MDRPLKVLLFTDTFCDANGVSRFLQDMASLARERSHDFTVVTVTAKPRCRKGENVIILKPRWRMKMPFYTELDLVLPPIGTLRRLLREHRPDLAHISTPGPVGLVASSLAAAYGIPRVGVYHTDFPAYVYKNTRSRIAKWLSNWLMRRFYRHFGALFVRSEAYRDLLARELDFPQEKIHLLQPGTDTERFHPRFRDPTIWERYGIDPDSCKVLYVGRLSKEKNIDRLLELWRELREERPDLRLSLILVGEGSLLAQASRLRQQGVYCLGYKGGEELSTLYASSDLFVFPSTTDTLGQVVMEAMASGLPVIVTDRGGPATLLRRQKPRGGLILPPEEKERWKRALETLCSNGAFRKRLGREAHGHAQKLSIRNSHEHFWELHRHCFTKSGQKSPDKETPPLH